MALIHQAYIKKKGPATWCYQSHTSFKPANWVYDITKINFLYSKLSYSLWKQDWKGFQSHMLRIKWKCLQVLDNLTSSWRLLLDFLITTWLFLLTTTRHLINILKLSFCWLFFKLQTDYKYEADPSFVQPKNTATFTL